MAVCVKVGVPLPLSVGTAERVTDVVPDADGVCVAERVAVTLSVAEVVKEGVLEAVVVAVAVMDAV